MGLLGDIFQGLNDQTKYVPDYKYLSDSQLMSEYEELMFERTKYRGDEKKHRMSAVSYLLGERGYKHNSLLSNGSRWVRK